MGKGLGGFGHRRTSSSRNFERFTGEPGLVIKHGNVETRIGSDGRADKERHHTDHGNPRHHTNPHDHTIQWDASGNPQFGRQINYPDGNIPNFN
jgi:uncharacterized protein YcsI (UPF0317 family)